MIISIAIILFVTKFSLGPTAMSYGSFKDGAKEPMYTDLRMYFDVIFKSICPE
jgi:hypothetical protein